MLSYLLKCDASIDSNASNVTLILERKNTIKIKCIYADSVFF